MARGSSEACVSIGSVFRLTHPAPTPGLKDEVRRFWDAEPCGTRYLESAEDFVAHTRSRYALEPYIERFAQFDRARGLRVLEIGVGMGADYVRWLQAGARAAGVDLSRGSLERAHSRCQMMGMTPTLCQADAERLPFPDGTFDLVYSYGVLHHSPDTPRCVQEVFRILKPGGQARLMLYHHPSLTGLMLWLRYGWWRGKSVRQAVYGHLESPGTKTYTAAEIRAMMSGFGNLHLEQVFSPGDLLLHQPSARFRGSLYRLAWKLYPRWMVRRLGRRLGLFLLITAERPAREVS